MSIGSIYLLIRDPHCTSHADLIRNQFRVRLSNRESGLPYNSLRCLTGGIIELGIGASVYGAGGGDIAASGAWEADVTSSGTGC